MRLPPKRYIGDGVYIYHDGFSVVITTEDGIRATNRIVLEPEGVVALEGYLGDVRKAIVAAADEKGGKDGGN